MYSRFTSIAFLILLVLPAFLADEQLPLHRRTARSVGGFFKRIFSRSKQGFQGTSNVNTLYNAQQSSYFPNYASFLTQPTEQLNTAASFADYTNQNSQISPYSLSSGYAPSSYGQGISLNGANSNQEASLNSQPDLSSYASNYGNLAASPNTQYANYAALPSNQMTSYASNGQNVDFHKVLDNFVRSAGLNPNGDHDVAASSNVEQKDTTPVFSFKKLYSFPFYLNAGEPNSNEGSYFTIPYMRKHIKRVSSDSTNQQVQPQTSSPSSAASSLMNYFGGKKLSDITKLYNYNQKYLQNVPAALNASFYSPIYGNQLKRLAYYQAQQIAKQNSASNQLPPEIHLINSNLPSLNQHLPNLNNQQQQQQQHASPNVMNQATNAYPTFSQPAAPLNSQQAQAQSSNKQILNSNVAAPLPPSPQSTTTANQAQAQPQFQPIKVNQPVHPSVTSAVANQKQQQQQQQQQALIQQAISNPQAFISQYITQQYSQQQQQQQSSNSNNLNNNSNKLSESNSENNNGDLADEYSGSSYYYGQPQVSVSSSTSTKVSGQQHKQPTTNASTSNQSSSSSSSAVSNQQQSNSNA